MMKPYLTLFMASNREKLLKKSCKTLNSITFENVTNYQMGE